MTVPTDPLKPPDESDPNKKSEPGEEQKKPPPSGGGNDSGSTDKGSGKNPEPLQFDLDDPFGG